MKPRTKAHFEIVGLVNYVKDLEDDKDFRSWAFKDCLQHIGFATKSKVLCLDCGDTFLPTLVSRKKATCPHCQTKIVVTDSRCTTNKQTTYIASAEIIGEYQVIRNFELIAKYKKGQKADYFLHEILQQWVHPEKKMQMFGKSHILNGYCDNWGGPMEIREENSRGWHGKKYDVYARNYYPKSIFKSEYSKYGINGNLKGITFLEAIRVLPKNPKAETLLKAKQYAILGHYCSNFYEIGKYWGSIKICLRNNYKVTDASMYYDYLQLLNYFKKDLHNAKFVCPKNLKSEHDLWMKKKREILRLQEQERNRLQIIKRQENLEKAITEYVNRNKKFLGLEFKKDDLSIKLLQNIDEFKIEGDELKHCVYTNEYYNKEHSLIFSATVNGTKKETIEFDLVNFKIDQARGLNNNPTEHHESIISLFNKNISKIRKIVEEPKNKKRNQNKKLKSA